MTPQPLIGSVCTGYGGLDMAVQQAAYALTLLRERLPHLLTLI